MAIVKFLTTQQNLHNKTASPHDLFSASTQLQPTYWTTLTINISLTLFIHTNFQHAIQEFIYTLHCLAWHQWWCYKTVAIGNIDKFLQQNCGWTLIVWINTTMGGLWSCMQVIYWLFPTLRTVLILFDYPRRISKDYLHELEHSVQKYDGLKSDVPEILI